jgi:hypothetical protein
VTAGPEGVAELAGVDELHHLRFADDQLGPVLDFLVVVREAIRQRVARVVGPLDDVDELPLQKVHQGHVVSLLDRSVQPESGRAKCNRSILANLTPS